MSDQADGPTEAWEQMLRELLGPQADDAIRMMREQGLDPAALAEAQGLPSDPAVLQQIFSQVQRLAESSDGQPVNWEIAHDLARATAVSGGDPVPSEAEQRWVREALTVADLWLDTATELPAAAGTSEAMSRSGWVERTLPAWHGLTEPVAMSVAAALARALSSQLPTLMEEAGGPAIDATALLQRLGSAVFGMQVGQAAGTLSHEVLGLADLGIPLVSGPAVALVPANVDAFADGLASPLSEVRLYLAVREAAHARLFTHVPWLRASLLSSIDAYARGITIDVERLEDQLASVDPSRPEQIQEALAGGVFDPQTTPEQRAALERLETSLALVEGWVETVTSAATEAHLPDSLALRETIRRRRAAGGPAEQTFATLVGLELRPRRSRDAAALWEAITETSGISGRDAVWGHPDLLPGTGDLDDPAGWAARHRDAEAAEADVDKALADLLADEDGSDTPGGRPQEG